MRNEEFNDLNVKSEYDTFVEIVNETEFEKDVGLQVAPQYDKVKEFPINKKDTKKINKNKITLIKLITIAATAGVTISSDFSEIAHLFGFEARTPDVIVHNPNIVYFDAISDGKSININANIEDFDNNITYDLKKDDVIIDTYTINNPQYNYVINDLSFGYYKFDIKYNDTTIYESFCDLVPHIDVNTFDLHQESNGYLIMLSFNEIEYENDIVINVMNGETLYESLSLDDFSYDDTNHIYQYIKHDVDNGIYNMIIQIDDYIITENNIEIKYDLPLPEISTFTIDREDSTLNAKYNIDILNYVDNKIYIDIKNGEDIISHVLVDAATKDGIINDIPYGNYGVYINYDDNVIYETYLEMIPDDEVDIFEVIEDSSTGYKNLNLQFMNLINDDRIHLQILNNYEIIDDIKLSDMTLNATASNAYSYLFEGYDLDTYELYLLVDNYVLRTQDNIDLSQGDPYPVVNNFNVSQDGNNINYLIDFTNFYDNKIYFNIINGDEIISSNIVSKNNIQDTIMDVPYGIYDIYITYNDDNIYTSNISMIPDDTITTFEIIDDTTGAPNKIANIVFDNLVNNTKIHLELLKDDTKIKDILFDELIANATLANSYNYTIENPEIGNYKINILVDNYIIATQDMKIE